MKIKWKFTFQIDIGNQNWFINLIAFCFFDLLSQFIVISLIRFNLIEIILFWNWNLKSNGSDGPSRPITTIAFCRTNISDGHFKHLQLKHIGNYLHPTFQ